MRARFRLPSHLFQPCHVNLTFSAQSPCLSRIRLYASTSVLSHTTRVLSTTSLRPRKGDPDTKSVKSSKEAATEESPVNPSLDDLGRVIRNDFAHFQDHYSTPKYTIVLAHGLMGFDELKLPYLSYLPSIHYWRGITDAFRSNGINYITTAVPATASISERAQILHEQISERARGQHVNIIAHSMGGLDARYLISKIQPQSDRYSVASLTTIATPHHGSSAADMILREIGPDYLPRLYALCARIGVSTGAFTQLTTSYLREEFNPSTKDVDGVNYFSYGASATPHIFSAFRLSHDLMVEIEGANDGLVSVQSSKWGEGRGQGEGYKGTLMGVTHLDLINWTNRIKRVVTRMGLMRQDFDAIAFYLHIADMLAKEGL